MRCFECGHLNPEGAQYCNLCGRRISKKLFILDGQPPNEAKRGDGDGFHPARFAQHNINNEENINALPALKVDRACEKLDTDAAKSAFHPARISTPAFCPNSASRDSMRSYDAEATGLSDVALFKKSTDTTSSAISAANKEDYSMHSPWFHAARLHAAEKPIDHSADASGQERSASTNEAVTEKSVWRLPRLFNKRGTNRLYSDTPIEEIMIEPPPKTGELFRANWKSVLFVPAIVLSLIAALLALILLNSTSSSTFYILLFAAMVVVGLSGGIAEYLLQASQWRANEELKKLRYIKYLEKLEREWNARAERQLKSLSLQNPSIEGCIALLESCSERVWERKERDDDFLCVRVGKGERPFELGILMSPVSFEEREAELYKRAQALVESHRHISPVPALLDLKMRTLIGILGNSAATSPIIQNIIFQLTTFHSPKAVEIILLGADRNDTAWAKIFQLPHVLRIGETYEAEVCAVQSLLTLRSQMLHQPVHEAEIGENRFLILFLLQGEEREESDFEALSLLAARGFKTCVITQRTTQTIFPPQEELIINVTNGDGEIYQNQMDEAPLQISLDSFSSEQSSRFLGALRGFQT